MYQNPNISQDGTSERICLERRESHSNQSQWGRTRSEARERFNVARDGRTRGGSRRSGFILAYTEKQPFSRARARARDSRQPRTNEQTQLFSLVCNRPICQATSGTTVGRDVSVQRELHRQIAERRGREREGGGTVRARSTVMTVVLREAAGLNQYPDIERVGDTLTIPDPGSVVTHPRPARYRRNEKRRWRTRAAADNDVRRDYSRASTTRSRPPRMALALVVSGRGKKISQRIKTALANMYVCESREGGKARYTQR